MNSNESSDSSREASARRATTITSPDQVGCSARRTRSVPAWILQQQRLAYTEERQQRRTKNPTFGRTELLPRIRTRQIAQACARSSRWRRESTRRMTGSKRHYGLTPRQIHSHHWRVTATVMICLEFKHIPPLVQSRDESEGEMIACWQLCAASSHSSRPTQSR